MPKLLKDMLDEFEADWAGFPCRSPQWRPEIWEEKTILVSGAASSLSVRGILYSFLWINDFMKKHCLDVYFAPGSDEIGSLYSDLLSQRDDFHIWDGTTGRYFDYAVIPEIITWKDFEFGISDFVDNYSKIYQLFMQIRNCVRTKIILLSDCRIYPEDNQIPFAEYEYTLGNQNRTAIQELIACVECLFCSFFSQQSCNYSILRTAPFYGKGIPCPLEIINRISRSLVGTHHFPEEDEQFCCSLIYFGDFLNAIFWDMGIVARGQIFNVCGTDETLTPQFLAYFRKKHYSDFSPEAVAGKTRSHLISAQKAIIYGWNAHMNLEDGLYLLFESALHPTSLFRYPCSYSGKLQNIHRILLEYLLELDRICRKYQIRYFLAGGTLLGVVRHQGFIPWDDDVDIMMLRDDYDHFANVIQKESDNIFFLQNSRTEPGNHNVFNKVRLNRTVLVTRFSGKFPWMHNGVFIDILAQDTTGNHIWSQKLHLKLTNLLRSIVICKWEGTSITSSGKHPILCKIVNLMLPVFPICLMEKLQNLVIGFFKNFPDRKFLYDGMGRNLDLGAFPGQWLSEVEYLPFEGHMLPVPKGYDSYLTYLYGDYMQMIPPSERKSSHSIVWIDLGEYLTKEDCDEYRIN